MCVTNLSDAVPSSNYAPTGQCPFCTHCKNGICDGDEGPSYYECPKNWRGNICKGEAHNVIVNSNQSFLKFRHNVKDEMLLLHVFAIILLTYICLNLQNVQMAVGEVVVKNPAQLTVCRAE